MYCKNCGETIDDRAVVCPKCGIAQTALQTSTAAADRGGFGWGLLGFCIPLIGLILFLVWRDDKPLTAKAAGMGALAAIIIGIAVYAILAILGISLVSVGSI